VIFFGTPAYAVPVLRTVAALPGVEVVVVTRPDAPKGRGRQLVPSPVRVAAESLGLMVWTPRRIGPRTIARMAAWRPAWGLTAAYGLILPPAALAQFHRGAYNLHASLLPRWRGPNPIAWAIRAGDPVTGVTLMRMDAGVDTGPVLRQAVCAIDPLDTTGTLGARLGDLAADLWRDSWSDLVGGRLTAAPQVGSVTYAPKDAPAVAQLDWTQTAPALERQIRSMLPDPGPYTRAGAVRIKILRADVVSSPPHPGAQPGMIWRAGRSREEWVVTCGSIETALRIHQLQPAGRRPMTPGAFDRGQASPPERLS